MANKLYEESHIQAIADAIREKTGESGTMKLSEMPDKIESIPSGSSATEPYIEETYDSNGDLTSFVLHGYTKIRQYMFRNCQKLTINSLPSEITVIGSSAFQDCKSLVLTSLPNGLERIEASTFAGCSSLETLTMPDELTNITSNAFQNCTGLTEVIFKKKAGLSSSVFSGCTALTSIKVPWAEGEVTNAPWGATNATITYNYTGD